MNGGFFSAIHGMSYFTDFKTNTAVPICNKPDCRHLSTYEDAETACNAAKGSNNIFPYKGKLYGMMSDEDGTRLVVSEFDGSNRKEKDYFIDAGCEHTSQEAYEQDGHRSAPYSFLIQCIQIHSCF